MAKSKSKKSTQVGGRKIAQKKLIEGAGKIPKKVAAKATATKRKAAPKTVQQDIDAIAEQVPAKAAERKTQMVQQAPGGVDQIADLVAARLGQTSDLVQEMLTKQVDKIVDLVASRLGQTSDLTQQTVGKGIENIGKFAELGEAKLTERRNNMTQQTSGREVDKITELVAAKLAEKSGKVAQQTSEEEFERIAELIAAKLAGGSGKARQATEEEVEDIANKEAKVKVTTMENTKLSTVPLNWKEVYYTNCPLISAANVDQELGWTKSEFKKIEVNYLYLRARKENDWYPHYIHNLDNMIRFGGLFPPIAVQADIRRTRLLGVTHAPREGGAMMVRAGDDIFRMVDLKGKKIGLSKSMNRIKNDWWRIQEHQGIELMLRINGMTMDDIVLVEFPYADDWYNDPKMIGPEMENPSELWLKRDHKHDLAFRPLETALEKGVIDAAYIQSGPLQQLQEATGKFTAIEDLSRHPDWRLQVANIPAAITCTEEMATKHPELAVTFMKGMIKVGRWANAHKRAAAEILDKQTFYLDPEHTYEGIKPIDLVPNLSPQNLVSVEIGKDFMLNHGYIKNDFDVHEWAAPEFLEAAAKELVEARWRKVTEDKLPEPSELLASSRRIG